MSTRSHRQQGEAWRSFGLLLVSLIAVVGLAKMLSSTIEHLVVTAGAPRAVIGIVIAMLVLLPETWAATRAARADRLQTSMNLAIGSALASIGLTVPVVVAAAILFNLPLTLGLEPKDLVLLAVTWLVSTVTLRTRPHPHHAGRCAARNLRGVPVPGIRTLDGTGAHGLCSGAIAADRHDRDVVGLLRACCVTANRFEQAQRRLARRAASRVLEMGEQTLISEELLV